MSNFEKPSWPPKPTLPEPTSRPTYSRLWLVRVLLGVLLLGAVNVYGMVNMYKIGLHSNQASRLYMEHDALKNGLIFIAAGSFFVWASWSHEKSTRQKKALL